jgi:hypothetical protein
MFTRTVTPDTKTGPDREQLTEEQFCPPHDFDATWALPSREDLTAETVPARLCRACGRTELLVIDDAPTP